MLLAHHLHVGALRLHWRVEAVRLVLLGGHIKLGHSIGLLSRHFRASIVIVMLTGLLLVNLLLILIAAQLFLYIYGMLEGSFTYLIISCKAAPPSYINK
jgi:hypothetical protein